ncbi:hypothetical protein ABIE78_003511 [Sinorhizobium fredii]|uniref:Uncharacterized protein n=1 Tax=Sinorhizobium fredii (strain USDA 257) TaxID=1185652 RepID=I3X490_SINF2|nr:hypothetical protein [Sinorhizobium fredii]AFL50696.1 hypothetical protein USDA257_c21140 [Sinorhizobium fredii USDA 257]
MTAAEVSLVNQLAARILFANPAMRLASAFKKTRLDREALWSRGISGDRPIVLVRVDGDRDNALISRCDNGARLCPSPRFGVRLRLV